MRRTEVVNQISRAIRRVAPTATGILVSPVIMLRKQWENRPFKTLNNG